MAQPNHDISNANGESQITLQRQSDSSNPSSRERSDKRQGYVATSERDSGYDSARSSRDSAFGRSDAHVTGQCSMRVCSACLSDKITKTNCLVLNEETLQKRKSSSSPTESLQSASEQEYDGGSSNQQSDGDKSGSISPTTPEHSGHTANPMTICATSQCDNKEVNKTADALERLDMDGNDLTDCAGGVPEVQRVDSSSSDDQTRQDRLDPLQPVMRRNQSQTVNGNNRENRRGRLLGRSGEHLSLDESSGETSRDSDLT